MSKKRLTKEEAKEVYNQILNNVKLSKFGDDGVTLPKIDFDAIFGSQKTKDVGNIIKEVVEILNNWKPT